LLEYLRKVDPAFLAQVEKPLQPLLAKETLTSQKPSAEALASWQAPLAEIQKRLAAQHAAYAKKSSERDWRFAVRHADLLAYLVDISGHPGDRYISRDRIMAENLRWLLEQEGPDAKMVAWAHNGHVSTGNALPFVPLGRNLRQALGDSLFVFGLVFNQGSFQAMDGGGDPPRGLIVHTVPPARPGTLDAVLASVGKPLYALDVRDTPRDSPLGALFRETRHSRQIGAVYAPNYTDDKLTLAEEFDGVFFVDTSTPATATPTGRRPPPPQAPKPSP
jgi:erythromycin esterase